MGRQTEFIFLALVICALTLSSLLQPRSPANLPAAVTPGITLAAPLHPPESAQPPLEEIEQQSRSDATSTHAELLAVAEGHEQKRLRVRLIMLVLNVFPAWWPFLVASYRRSHPSIELLVVHANVSRPAIELHAATEHVQYAELSVSDLVELFARKLRVAPHVHSECVGRQTSVGCALRMSRSAAWTLSCPATQGPMGLTATVRIQAALVWHSGRTGARAREVCERQGPVRPQAVLRQGL